MQTQITCPSCGSPFTGEVHQIVDVGLEPDLKDLLLNGHLNVVQCPTCGTVTQVSTSMLYHDPAHELFLVYMPMEMNLSHAQQQEQIGQLVKRAMDRLPAEQRRGYMLQPQTLINLQTLMEKVLETEGITPEMLSRQRKQAELLQQLLTVDKQAADALIRQHDADIDETFFAMLRSVMDSFADSDQEVESLTLINLQAKLYKQTTVGRRLERQQLAVHAFTREANRQGLSPKLLLKHVLANRDDKDIVRALVLTGQQAFDYQFFLLFTEKIEKREKAGVDVQAMVSLRDELLEMQQQMEKQSREALTKANETLTEILAAKDKAAAVQTSIDRIDELFMMVLSANLSQAEEAGEMARLQALREVQEAILYEMERQAPPEIRLVNQLVRAESPDRMNQLLDENQNLIKPELLQLVKRIESQAEEQGNTELREQLDNVHSIITRRLLT